MVRMPGTPYPVFTRSLLAPRLWPAWIGVGIMKLIAMLPWKVLMAIGRTLGAGIERFPSPRREVAATNIALCFPELDAAAQKKLVDAHLRDIGMMLIEFALGWMGSDRAIARIPVRFEGLEHLEAAHAQGRGVLLVGGHFSHL
jgi:KDO2-lipid IV(A) lauroyltransferase